MNDQVFADARYAMIVHTLEEGGPLRLQKRFQKAREAAPGASLDQLAHQFVDLELALRGPDCVQKLEERHVSVVTFLDEAYPRLLREIPDPPLVLFYCGALQALHRPSVSIVGSRKHSTYGGGVATSLAAELARLGFVITSGLARGIDTRAHKAALDVQGLTVAVLGSGPDHIYPKENRNLALRIIKEGGIVISEFPPGTPIKPFHFPIRNRIISGLSHATVLVEAEEKSGTLITARHCLEQGRELLAVPGQIQCPTAQGTNQLIARGEARLLKSVADVLEELQPLLGLAAAHKKKVEAHIEDQLARKIYNRLDAYQPIALDALVAETGEPPGIITAHLLDLETRGFVERIPGAQFLRNPIH